MKDAPDKVYVKLQRVAASSLVELATPTKLVRSTLEADRTWQCCFARAPVWSRESWIPFAMSLRPKRRKSCEQKEAPQSFLCATPVLSNLWASGASLRQLSGFGASQRSVDSDRPYAQLWPSSRNLDVCKRQAQAVIIPADFSN